MNTSEIILADNSLKSLGIPCFHMFVFVFFSETNGVKEYKPFRIYKTHAR